MSTPLRLDAFLLDLCTEPPAVLVSQALRLRWQVLEHARLGDWHQARQDFRALQGVAARLQRRGDSTLDDIRLADLCMREADLAVLTCRVWP